MYSFSYCILQFLFFKTYFIYLHWISHWVHPFFSWVQWAYFWLCLTLYLLSFLSLFHSVLFLRFYVLFGKYSFVFSFCLFFFVCFYILSIYATPVVFKNWPYVEGILWDSVAHFPLVTKARYFLVLLGPLCGPCVTSLCGWAAIVAGTLIGEVYPLAQLLWIHWWVRLAPRPAGWEGLILT